MKTNHKIYIGDARDWLKRLEPNYRRKVALLITSPPYFVGRGYEDYLHTEYEYFRLLRDVFAFAIELIEPHGKIAVNFADRYANKKLTNVTQEVSYIPFYLKMFRELGYVLWTRIIWRKEYTIGEDCKHVLSAPNKYGHMRVSPNWEYIFVWKRISTAALPKKKVDMTKDEWAEWVDGVWVIPSVRKNYKIDGKKVAMFPPELPRRLIKMYTQPGDIVLDPFTGTGTTNKAAADLGRNSIGIELQEANLPFIEETMGIAGDYTQVEDLFGNLAEVDITVQQR